MLKWCILVSKAMVGYSILSSTIQCRLARKPPHFMIYRQLYRWGISNSDRVLLVKTLRGVSSIQIFTCSYLSRKSSNFNKIWYQNFCSFTFFLEYDNDTCPQLKLNLFSFAKTTKVFSSHIGFSRASFQG